MTYREWWYKTAPIDILYEFADKLQQDGICAYRFITNNIDKICLNDCHKCMERLLNEERPTQSKHTS